MIPTRQAFTIQTIFCRILSCEWHLRCRPSLCYPILQGPPFPFYVLPFGATVFFEYLVSLEYKRGHACVQNHGAGHRAPALPFPLSCPTDELSPRAYHRTKVRVFKVEIVLGFRRCVGDRIPSAKAYGIEADAW